MATLGEVVVKFGADISGIQRAAQQTQNLSEQMASSLERVGRVGRELKSIGAGLTVGLTAPILAAGTASVKAAMEAVESENLFRESFKNMSNSARDWSETVSEALGLNAYEVRKNSATLYTMLNSMKLNEEAAFDMSTGLTQLAYDMASFYNLDPTAAFDKLRAGITGETEPLKALGILLNEATLETYAYEQGIAEVGATLNEQQKVLARYAAIMGQTSDAQGDLSRTIDSPANKMRVLKERAKQASITFGTSLLPAFESALNAIEPVVKSAQSLGEKFASLSEGQKKAILTITGITVALPPLAAGIGLVTTGLASLNVVTGGIILALGAVAAGATYLAANWDTVKAKTVAMYKTMDEKLGALKYLVVPFTALIDAGLWLADNWGVLDIKAQKVFTRIKISVLSAVETILNGFSKLTGIIPGVGDKVDDVTARVRQLRVEAEATYDQLGKTEMIRKSNEAYDGSSEALTLNEQKLLRRQEAQERATKSTVVGTQTTRTNTTALHGNTTATTANTAAKRDQYTVMEQLQDRLSIVGKEMKLFRATTDAERESTAYLTEEVGFLEQKLDIVNEQVKEATKAYEASVKAKGKDAEATRKLYGELLDLQTQQAKVRNEIEETTKAMTEQAQQVALDQAKNTTLDSDRISFIREQVQGGGTISDEEYERYQERLDREAERIANERDVPLDVARDMAKKEIPGLATGGTVTSGGLTLVGERGPELLNLPTGSQVVPNYELPKVGAQKGGDVHLHLDGNTFMSRAHMDDFLTELVRHMKLAGVNPLTK